MPPDETPEVPPEVVRRVRTYMADQTEVTVGQIMRGPGLGKHMVLLALQVLAKSGEVGLELPWLSAPPP